MGEFRRAIQKSSLNRNIFAAPLLVGLLAVAVVVMIYSAAAFHSQLDDTRTAASDSRVWSVAQIEVDHQNLLYALAEYQRQQFGVLSEQDNLPDQPKLSVDDVKTAYDIFYSRASIVAVVLDTKTMRHDVKTKVTALLRARETLTKVFDQLDFNDPKALAAFQADIAALKEPIRQMTIEALDCFVIEAEAARNQEAVLWGRVLITTFALLGIMASAMYLAGRLRRQIGTQLKILQRATDNIRMVYETATLAIIITDRKGKVQLFNPEAQKLFGLTQSEMIGTNIAESLIPHHLLPKHLEAMDRYSTTGQGTLIDGGPVQTVGLRADGTEVQIELSIRANHDLAGEETLIAFVRDISQQLSYEETLRAARDEARRHAAAKSKFLATMSHEMRTPLYGLLASLNLIEIDSVPPAARKLISTARDCGKRSLEQINDVLQISQMDEVQEPLALIDPPALVTDILKELRALAIDHENHLMLNVTGDVPKQLWLGQPRTFVRVMYNLIGNAIKFTHQGNVTISMAFTTDLPRGATLLVDVTDTGVGIAAEDCKQIFDPFFTATENRAGGAKNHTGLGLAIAKMGTEKMSGHLNMSSKLGQGSSFFFEIPLLAAPESSAEEPVPAPLETGHQFDMTCLVVDDNQVNLDLTAQMLRKIGCKVLIADNGGEAIKLCSDNDFDVVFMDLNMPGGLSGTEAAHIIRSSGHCPDATMIALTADATFQGPDVLAATKLDLVLHKPVDVDDLVSTLNKVRLRRETGAINDQSNAPKTPGKRTQEGSFDQLFELVGDALALKFLAGVQDDINAVTQAIVQLGPNAADQLHRAIGSTAAIGLVQLSKSLREAEDLVRNGTLNQPSQQFGSLHKHIADAQRELTRALK